MKENTNSAIAYNTIYLYIKLIVLTVCNLLITRFALQALGVVDFGLFSVVGSVITFITVINTIMISTSNRFIAVAIGKGIIEEVNTQFNVNLIVHIAIALITVLIAFPLGDWYIYNYINYDGDINLAVSVYNITIIGSIIAFIGVPYNGLLMAKEKFGVFCLVDIAAHLMKLAITCYLVFFSNKLLIYAFAQALMAALPTLCYFIYCRNKYKDITRFIICRDYSSYKQVFSFSGWVAYGAVACVGKNQGAALLVNAFFNTVMNAGLGIANNVNHVIVSFAENITKPIAPQITKNYVSGNMDRCYKLLAFSTKCSYVMTLLISLPFFIEPEWLFNLWLGKVPEYAVSYTQLLMIDALISVLYSSISNIIFADGNIKLYQISVNTLRLGAILAAYFVLKNGFSSYTLFYAYIAFSVVIFIISLFVLKRVVNIEISKFVKDSIIPVFILSLFFVTLFFYHAFENPIFNLVVDYIFILVVIFFFGLIKSEREYLKSVIKNKFIHTKI